MIKTHNALNIGLSWVMLHVTISNAKKAERSRNPVDINIKDTLQLVSTFQDHRCTNWSRRPSRLKIAMLDFSHRIFLLYLYFPVRFTIRCYLHARSAMTRNIDAVIHMIIHVIVRDNNRWSTDSRLCDSERRFAAPRAMPVTWSDHAPISGARCLSALLFSPLGKSISKDMSQGLYSPVS